MAKLTVRGGIAQASPCDLTVHQAVARIAAGDMALAAAAVIAGPAIGVSGGLTIDS